MFMGMLSFTALLGSAAMGSISDIYGRRATFLSSSTTFNISLSIIVVACSFLRDRLRDRVGAGHRPQVHILHPEGSYILSRLTGQDGDMLADEIQEDMVGRQAFSCGMGPGAWLIPTEVFTNDIRAKGMSVCTVANRTAALILTSSFLTINDGPRVLHFLRSHRAPERAFHT